jgi:hypothetical protein
MRDLIEQIRSGLQANLYYLSLFTVLAVPDICGAIDSEDGHATKKKYIEWFNKYVGPKYRQFLTGEDCYYFRCSLLHQGTLQPDRGKYSRLIFIEPSATTNILHCNIINDTFNIDVRIFCQDVVVGATQWLNEVEGSERFERNLNKFVRRHPGGLTPYIVGVPVIG